MMIKRIRCVGIEINTETQSEFKVTLISNNLDISLLDKWKQRLGNWIDVEEI